MKITFKILLIILIIGMVVGCNKNDKFEQFKLKLSEAEKNEAVLFNAEPVYVNYFEDMNDLYNSHNLVIYGIVKEIYQIELGDGEYYSIPFTIAKIDIKKVYKGDLEKKDIIYVLETGGYYYPIIRKPDPSKPNSVIFERSNELHKFEMSGRIMEKEDELLLFMVEFDGPQEEIFGSELYYANEGQGKFFLDKDIIKSSDDYYWNNDGEFILNELEEKIK